MTVDWSRFRDKDRLRVTFEGTWDAYREGLQLAGPAAFTFYVSGYLEQATSAELIERPFTPPAAGKLFRDRSADLYISDGSRYRCVRWQGRAATGNESQWFPWSDSIPSWRATIEVIDDV